MSIPTNNIGTPVNILWEKLSFFVSNTQDKYVPSKISPIRYSQSWFTRHCKKLVRKKNKPLRKSHKSKFSIDLQQLNPEKHVVMPIMSLSKSASMRTTIPVQNVFTLETKKLIILV